VSWVIFGLIVVGIVFVVWGFLIGRRARPEDYGFILPMILGVILIAIAFLLWVGRWIWGELPPWPWL